MDTDVAEPSESQNLYKPETVITPGSVTAPTIATTPLQQPAATQVEKKPEPAPSITAPSTAVAAALPEVSVPTQSAPTIEAANTAPTEPAPEAYADPNAITWTASEFIAHQKTAAWYGLLSLAAVIIAVCAWFVTKDIFATSTVIVGVLLLGIYAGRKPREQSYTLDSQGLTIGGRQYGYYEFRSFSVVEDGAFLAIELMPLQRFAVNTTIYFDPAEADKIMALLSSYLPMEEPHNNFADSLMRRIHF